MAVTPGAHGSIKLWVSSYRARIAECAAVPPSSPQQQYGYFGQRMQGVRRPDAEPCNLGTERLVQSCSAGWEQN